MRVPEARRVLQPVPEEAIGSDVREPDEGDLDGRFGIADHAHDGEHDRQHIRMDSVVARCTDRTPSEVPQHRQIGRENEEQKQESAEPRIEVHDKSTDRDSQSFQTKQAGRQSLEHQMAPLVAARKHSVT